MTTTLKRLGLGVCLLLALAGGYYFLDSESRQIDAAVAELRNSNDGTAERTAAQAKLMAYGQKAHEALFAMLRNDTAEVCAAIPLETFTTVQLTDAYRAMGDGGQVAVIQFVQMKMQSGNVELTPVVKAALTAKPADARKLAVILAAKPGLQLQSELPPLLRDSDAGVRVAALTALAAKADLVSDEALFPWLNDADAMVRNTCANVLLVRGRSEEEIQFGRRLCHPSAAERLNLLTDLQTEARTRDISPWLERLSTDHDPAVRAGAMRLATEVRLPWADWMAKLAASDPDETVRKMALVHYRTLNAVVPAGGKE